ncbi:Cation efflux protein [Trinorchestia longiramus]|nr:Cation efflux protein [Trinorchestia longiramus]
MNFVLKLERAFTSVNRFVQLLVQTSHRTPPPLLPEERNSLSSGMVISHSYLPARVNETAPAAMIIPCHVWAVIRQQSKLHKTCPYSAANMYDLVQGSHSIKQVSQLLPVRWSHSRAAANRWVGLPASHKYLPRFLLVPAHCNVPVCCSRYCQNFVVSSRSFFRSCKLSDASKPSDPTSNSSSIPDKSVIEDTSQPTLSSPNTDEKILVEVENGEVITNKSNEAIPTVSTAARLKDAVIKRVMPRTKEKQSMVSMERNFITAIRAMTEFLLKPSDLEGLRKTKRRSPFENEPRITVYWMKDVENKAIEKWGSKDAIEKEKLKREETQRQRKNLFNLRKLLQEIQLQQPHQQPSVAGVGAGPELGSRAPSKEPRGQLDASGKVVYTAVAINGLNFLLKLGAWLYTGSACMFAEALHSFADTSNQLILAYGIHKSMQQANPEHPYGYSNMPYVSSLISGAMIFCLGAGVSVYHGISGLISPPEVMPLYWAFCILGGSLVTEGGTLIMAVHAIRKGAQQHNMSFKDYVLNGEDPSVNVVLLEDTAAVVGVGVALSCLTLTSSLSSTTPDAIGSCIIGGILGLVAAFIIRSNVGPLVGRSIPQRELLHMNRIMEQDVMVRALHDVKGIDMGTGLVRYKAEVDFDGRELTRAYISKQPLQTLIQELDNCRSPEEKITFLLNFGENVVDTLGAEIDRIEQSLKKAHPEVRHCDLEIL